MKQYLRQASFCVLAVMSAVMSTATFACPTLPVRHAPNAGTSQAHVGFHWHNKSNPLTSGHK